MKFEKKVIIGSLSSFLVAAVGFIAVFFPSLFSNFLYVLKWLIRKVLGF